MRNILALLAAAVLTVAGVGWYLGWYNVQSTAQANGKRQVKVDIDGQKISEDLQRGTNKIQSVLETSPKVQTTEQSGKTGSSL